MRGVVGFDPIVVRIVDIFRNPGTHTTYELFLDNPLLTPARVNARASVFLIMNTVDTSPILIASSPLPPILAASQSPPILTLRCGDKTKHYYPKQPREANNFSPRIDIDAYSAAMDQNFGEVLFTVLDTTPHSGTIDCKNRLVAPGVYESVFSKFPQINCMLKVAV